MSLPFGVTTSIAVILTKGVDDAVSLGYNYSHPEYRGAKLTKAVIVPDGTVEGNPTVDLIFEDENGQKYVGMITGKLLKAVAGVL